MTRSRDENATLPEDTNGYLEHLKVAITKLIAPLAPGLDITRAGVELSDILRDAVELSKFFRQQRPCWSVRFLDTREMAGDMIIRYKTDTMRDHQFDDLKNRMAGLCELEVDFVVSPGLYKRGTLEGDQFERESIVKKIEVVVRPKDA